MAMVLDYDDEATSKCSNCRRAIPSSNIFLHYAHCLRTLQKCEICGIMIPKMQAEKHYLSIHAPVACSLCSEVVEQGILKVHREENCPRRMVSCEYCELPSPAAELLEHQEVCGNLTEYCNLCKKYIRLCNRVLHAAEHSRNVRPLERKRNQPPLLPPKGRWQSIVEKSPLLLATAGIAVILGSLFFSQKK